MSSCLYFFVALFEAEVLDTVRSAGDDVVSGEC